MVRVVRVKNASGADGTWGGQTILAGAYYDLSATDLVTWPKKTEVYVDIGAGNLVVCKGATMMDDITDPVVGWNWLSNQQELPISDLDDIKLAVHASPKPLTTAGQTIYALWMGAGDDMTTGEIGGGDLLEFSLAPGTTSVIVDVRFHPDNGLVWLHEGYLRFNGGGVGDYLNASVMGEGTPLQTAVDLDLVMDADGTTIKYAPGGAGTGTHGFADADAIILAGRGFSNDGDWDYDGMNLTPNMAGTGAYRISTAEQTVHRFMHRIPVHGTSDNYFSMSSEETTSMPAHYFVRIEAHNISNTTWTASSIIETYRERTFNP